MLANEPLVLRLKQAVTKSVGLFTPQGTECVIVAYPDISADTEIAWAVSVDIRLPEGDVFNHTVTLTERQATSMLSAAKHVGLTVSKAIRDYRAKIQGQETKSV